jgi:hypothetical protein
LHSNPPDTRGAVRCNAVSLEAATFEIQRIFTPRRSAEAQPTLLMKYQMALGTTVHGLLEYVEAGGLMSYLQTRSIGFEDASLLASSPRIFWITVVARITFFVLSGLLAKIRQHLSWAAGFLL